MRRVMVALALTGAAWAGNACTSVSAGGAWSSAATWTSCGGGVPGAADTVTITVTGAGQVTCGQGVTCSAAGVTIADAPGATPTLDVSGTLDLHGPVTQGNATVQFEAGSTLQANVAADTAWTMTTGFSMGNRQIRFLGTSASHVTVASVGAGHLYFAPSASGNDGMNWNATYADFQGCGDATNDCVTFDPQGSGFTETCKFCSFDAGSGAMVWKTSPSATGGWDIEDSRFNQTGAKVRNTFAEPLVVSGGAPTTGVRNVLRSSFVKTPSIAGNGTVLTDNYFAHGITTPGSAAGQWTMTGSFVRWDQGQYQIFDGGFSNSFALGSVPYDIGDAAASYAGTASGSSATTLVDGNASAFAAGAYNASAGTVYFVEMTSGAGVGQRRAIVSNTANVLTVALPWGTAPASGDTYVIAADVANIHFAQPATGLTATSAIAYAGNVWQFTGTDSQGDSISHNGAHPVTMSGNILLPNGMGDNSFTPMSNGSDAGALNFNHNTWFLGAQALNLSEQSQTATAGTLQTLVDNIGWATAGVTYWQHGGSGGPYLVVQCAGVGIATCTSGYGVASGMDYNDAFNLATGYAKSALGATGTGYQINTGGSGQPGLHDKQVDPQFVDATRTFWSWAATADCGSTARTRKGLIADGLRCIQNNPTLTRTSLMPYIQAGFAPANAALHGAGHDGTDMGAVAVAARAASMRVTQQ